MRISILVSLVFAFVAGLVLLFTETLNQQISASDMHRMTCAELAEAERKKAPSYAELAKMPQDEVRTKLINTPVARLLKEFSTANNINISEILGFGNNFTEVCLASPDLNVGEALRRAATRLGAGTR